MYWTLYNFPLYISKLIIYLVSNYGMHLASIKTCTAQLACHTSDKSDPPKLQH